MQYCFGDIYGENYGFRTIVEFDESCEEGVNCDCEDGVDCELLEEGGIRGDEQFIPHGQEGGIYSTTIAFDHKAFALLG